MIFLLFFICFNVFLFFYFFSCFHIFPHFFYFVLFINICFYYFCSNHIPLFSCTNQEVYQVCSDVYLQALFISRLAWTGLSEIQEKEIELPQSSMLPRKKPEEDPMSSMERGGRAEGASQAAELALVPVGRKESKGRKDRGESSDGRGKVVTQQGSLEIEDVPNRPEGPPETFGPKQLEPLFNEEQMRQAEELAAKAPMLQNQRRASTASEWVGGSGVGEISGSPQELEVMGVRASMGVTPPGIMLPSMRLQPPPQMVSPNMGPSVLTQGYHPMQGWVEEQMRMQVQLQQEVMQLSQNMKSLQEENVRLKIQLVEERETKYSTPPDERMIEKSLKSAGKSGERRRSQQERLKEDGSRDQQERLKEDGSRDQQAHPKEDGPRGHQDLGEEDGPRGQQERSKEDGPRGQQEWLEEDGSRDQQDLEDGGEGGSETSSESPSESDPGREGKRRRRDRVSKDAFNTMLTLMQGMQKMQQQMLKHRSRSGKEPALNLREAVELSCQLSFGTSSSVLKLLSSPKTELPAQFYSW